MDPNRNWDSRWCSKSCQYSIFVWLFFLFKSLNRNYWANSVCVIVVHIHKQTHTAQHRKHTQKYAHTAISCSTLASFLCRASGWFAEPCDHVVGFHCLTMFTQAIAVHCCLISRGWCEQWTLQRDILWSRGILRSRSERCRRLFIQPWQCQSVYRCPCIFPVVDVPIRLYEEKTEGL